MAKKPGGTNAPKATPRRKRSYLSQTEVPSKDLEEAIRVPRAILENYGNDSPTPLQVAKALDMTPNSGHFRAICGAAIAYGLTEGGPNASEIAVTELAKRILKPMEEEGDDAVARREALLRPRVIGEFLRKYNGHSMPRADIGQNVLEGMGVPGAKTKAVLQLIQKGADSVGLLQEIKGKTYVELSSTPQARLGDTDDSNDGADEVPREDDPQEEGVRTGEGPDHAPNQPGAQDTARKRRVFITHGKNRAFLEPIKKLLAFGEMDPVVSADKQSVAKPVPDKVLEDMRSCGAAIIHVDAERKLLDSDANEHVVLNPNVLIEIGAAMALYGRRFILLVREGVVLPSNLQGLYEVRYQGDSLDGNATIRLLEAINDIKNNPLP